MCYDTYGKPVYNNSKATYSPKKQPKTDVRDLTAQSKVNVKEAAPAAESGGERKPMNLLKQVDSPKLTADPNAMVSD
ncbi:hypothetical protein HK097_003200 [Rhizophlyctis rosea]|uniref:Uncharacterized protein n=1 Tax=Rhizophlyctis rosea TaxID=64517 RepID=A0AAD5SG23_9FUNG|nr:hypothetical protein HK097_003200 [Rhizophlyctis rosea]